MNKTLHLFLALITVIFTGVSCKKLVEDKKKDLLVQAMVNGQWHVETYQEGSIIITDEFTDYNFKFYENGTVSGLKDTSDIEGTWSSDIQNYSISSNFPSATDPLKKLNGSWKIKDAKTDFVVAEMNSPQGKNILHLRKNQ